MQTGVSVARPSVESVNPLHAVADAAQLDTTSDGIELGHLNRPSLYEIVQANRNARNSADVSADVGERPPQPGGSGAITTGSFIVLSNRLQKMSSSSVERTRAWCKTEGILGAFIIVIYIIIIINLSLTLILH